MKKSTCLNSCQNCRHLNEDIESEMGCTYYSHKYCDLFDHYMNLKSFPFKKEMPCFQMSYMSAIWVDEEIKALYEQDNKNGTYICSEQQAYKRFKEKYQ